jgi:hypothetical protein
MPALKVQASRLPPRAAPPRTSCRDRVLELARGTRHLTDGIVELRGEQDIFGVAFDTRSWAAKSLVGTS